MLTGQMIGRARRADGGAEGAVRHAQQRMAIAGLEVLLAIGEGLALHNSKISPSSTVQPPLNLLYTIYPYWAKEKL